MPSPNLLRRSPRKLGECHFSLGAWPAPAGRGSLQLGAVFLLGFLCTNRASILLGFAMRGVPRLIWLFFFFLISSSLVATLAMAQGDATTSAPTAISPPPPSPQ